MFLIVSRTAAWMVAASGRTSAGRPRGSGLAAGRVWPQSRRNRPTRTAARRQRTHSKPPTESRRNRPTRTAARRYCGWCSKGTAGRPAGRQRSAHTSVKAQTSGRIDLRPRLKEVFALPRFPPTAHHINMCFSLFFGGVCCNLKGVNPLQLTPF